MPSGAKKRKAERRKKISDGSHPSSPTSSQPHEDHRLNSDATSGDEDAAAVAPVDGTFCAPGHEESEAATAAAARLLPEEHPHGVVEYLTVHAVEEHPHVALAEDLPSSPALEDALDAGLVKDLSTLPASEGAPEAAVVEDSSAPPPSENAPDAGVIIDSSAPPTSEGARDAGVVEDSVYSSPPPAADVSADAASSSHETKVLLAPLLRTSEGETEIPGTQLGKRATWWNCCGLLDLFTRS